MIRCNSEADSIVWMKEDSAIAQVNLRVFVLCSGIIIFQSFFM